MRRFTRLTNAFSKKLRWGMFGSLGYSQSALVLALALVPVYLVYRVWQHYGYTKSLEKVLSDRTDKSN